MLPVQPLMMPDIGAQHFLHARQVAFSKAFEILKNLGIEFEVHRFGRARLYNRRARPKVRPQILTRSWGEILGKLASILPFPYLLSPMRVTNLR